MKTFETCQIGDNVAYPSRLNGTLIFGRILGIKDINDQREVIIMWGLEEKELFLSSSIDYSICHTGNYILDDEYVKNMFFFNTEKELLNIKIKT